MNRFYNMNKIHFVIVLFFGVHILDAQSGYSLELVDRIWFDSHITTEGDTVGGTDVWGYTAPNGEEYALMGVMEGIAVVRISNMEIIDIVPGPFENGPYYYHRDIKTYSNYAYAMSTFTGTNQGLMIIDLSPLPDSVRFVGSYIHGSDTTAHNLSIDTATGYAYILKQDYLGFRVVNLADPENPEEVLSYDYGYLNDLYARNDTVYVCEYFAGSFSIFDFSDKTNPELLARVDVPNSTSLHNIWPTLDGNHVMTTEETIDRTVKMWNIEDMENIQLVGEYLGSNGYAHSTHIMGDFAYISHYSAGVTVVDISDPTNLIEVAQYDTYPFNDIPDPAGSGCWGAYPFTQNGMVFASNLEGYLTIMQFTETNISIIDAELKQIPNQIILHQNYPNPFNPVTKLRYSIPENGLVKIIIYDMMGRQVKTLVNQSQDAGYRSVIWDATNDFEKPVSAGIYLYQIQAGEYIHTKKMVLLK